MSSLVMRHQKHKTTSIGSACAHNERRGEIGNASIDPTRSIFNRELCPEAKKHGAHEIIKERIAGKVKRKDAVVCEEIFISAGPEFFKDKPASFAMGYFNQVHEWLKLKYGDRIVSMRVHFDEKTAHAHALIIPLDESKNLNAKKIFSPIELSKNQTELASFLQNSGYEIERGIKGSDAKHMSANEYKARCEKELTDEIEQLKMQLQEQQNLNQNLTKKINELTAEIAKLKPKPKKSLNHFRNDISI